MSVRTNFTTTIPAVNVLKLDWRLRIELGLPIEGVADELAIAGRIGIDSPLELTPEQQTTIASEIAAHDPTDYVIIQTVGLDTLNMRSVFYCVIVRRLADKYNETPTINTRNEATMWLNANSDFQLFSAGQRRFLRHLIDAIAEAAQVAMRSRV